MGFSVSNNKKDNNYNSIFVIIKCLTKIMHFKLVKVIIDISSLIKIIIDMIVQYHNISNSIINDQKAVFAFKF